MRDGFQMSRVYAPAVSAKVVDFETIWNRPDTKRVQRPMRSSTNAANMRNAISEPSL